ncbi:MAG: sigma-70 family RNA polymerase sigma factor [Deltaproteobacteria bacterium]|nr:MAG: sigma-70 family RNA polymerase sigma factor [Deltaproteobacteria bacterium]
MDEENLRARSVQRTWWMECAQRGDREAYGALLTDVASPLLRFLRRWIADPHELEDVHQDTLMALHRARHTYDPSRPFEPWLFAIARHVAVDHLRRRASRTSREVLVEALPEPGTDADPGNPRLEEALDRLPPAQREAFEMLQLEGISVAAAAARVGITTGALKVRAHRAYKALRALLGG